MRTVNIIAIFKINPVKGGMPAILKEETNRFIKGNEVLE